MLKFTKETYRFNNWYLFLIYVIISLALVYGYTHYIIQDEMYYNSIGDRLSSERIREMLDNQKKFQWLGYLFIPLKLIIKIGFTTVCIYLGAALMDYSIRFAEVFKVCLLAELIFMIGSLVLFALQLFFSKGETFAELQKLDYFSLYALFRSSDLPGYLSYPLQVINVFEIIYWILLAAGLQFFLQKPFSRMFSFVLGTYGIGLLCWIIFVVFMTINYGG
jgi:hypothetical protein